MTTNPPDHPTAEPDAWTTPRLIAANGVAWPFAFLAFLLAGPTSPAKLSIESARDYGRSRRFKLVSTEPLAETTRGGAAGVMVRSRYNNGLMIEQNFYWTFVNDDSGARWQRTGQSSELTKAIHQSLSRQWQAAEPDIPRHKSRSFKSWVSQAGTTSSTMTLRATDDNAELAAAILPEIERQLRDQRLESAYRARLLLECLKHPNMAPLLQPVALEFAKDPDPKLAAPLLDALALQPTIPPELSPIYLRNLVDNKQRLTVLGGRRGQAPQILAKILACQTSPEQKEAVYRALLKSRGQVRVTALRALTEGKQSVSEKTLTAICEVLVEMPTTEFQDYLRQSPAKVWRGHRSRLLRLTSTADSVTAGHAFQKLIEMGDPFSARELETVLSSKIPTHKIQQRETALRHADRAAAAAVLVKAIATADRQQRWTWIRLLKPLVPKSGEEIFRLARDGGLLKEEKLVSLTQLCTDLDARERMDVARRLTRAASEPESGINDLAVFQFGKSLRSSRELAELCLIGAESTSRGRRAAWLERMKPVFGSLESDLRMRLIKVFESDPSVLSRGNIGLWPSRFLQICRPLVIQRLRDCKQEEFVKIVVSTVLRGRQSQQNWDLLVPCFRHPLVARLCLPKIGAIAPSRQEAVDSLIALLSSDDRELLRLALTSLADYGEAAKPALGRLKELRAAKRSDATLSELIDKAIKRASGGGR